MSQRVETAKRLRRNETVAERLLWLRLRDRRLNGWKFKRQVPIDRCIADFCCSDARLIIELDGGQHSVQTVQDAKRTEILESMGYLVLRFWNNDVLKNTNGVLEAIAESLEQLSPSAPHPGPLPNGERGMRG